MDQDKDRDCFKLDQTLVDKDKSSGCKLYECYYSTIKVIIV